MGRIWHWTAAIAMFGIGCTVLAGARPLAIGDRVDASALCARDQALPVHLRDSLKLVTLLPRGSDYEGMLKYAFHQYFQAQLAFADAGSGRPVPNILPIYLQPADATASKSAPALATLAAPASGCATPDAAQTAALAAALGVRWPLQAQDSATVLLLDAGNVIRWRADDYRAQGERLKPLEKAVKALAGRPDPVAAAPVPPPPRLRVGDVAPDFEMQVVAPHGAAPSVADSTRQRLSGHRGQVVLLTFYPATLSGGLPMAALVDDGAFTRSLRDQQMAAMSCVGQLRSLSTLDARAAKTASLARTSARPQVVKLAVSASTAPLLQDWQRLLKTPDMAFVNDADYRIAQRYASYDAQAGHHRRKVFVIDRAGRIAYAGEDFHYADATAIQALLDRLSKK